MGFVTFASFNDTLSISHKKNIDKSFFSPEISLRTAVTFFMVRSVVINLHSKVAILSLQSRNSIHLHEYDKITIFETMTVSH